MKLDLMKLKSPIAPKQKEKNRKVKRLDYFAAVRGKRCFSFDFGEYSTKLTVANVSGSRIQIVKQIMIENRDHSRGIDEDNLNEWRGKILNAFSENKLNPAGQIGICAINSRHYIARQFEIPMADETDLQGLAAFELAQNLELDMDEYIFQHKVLRTYERNGKNMCTVWTAAVSKSLCQNYYNLLASLKLKPLILDVHVNGLEAILAADKDLNAKSQNNSVVMIDFGLRNTELYIFSNGSCVQTSNIDTGEGKLIAAAKIALGAQIVDIHNSNKLTVPPEEIYSIISEAENSESAAVFADVVQKWIVEINNVVRRFNIDHPGQQIEHVFIYGGSQQLPWLKVYLEKLLEIPVEILDELSCFRVPGDSSLASRYLNSASVLLRKKTEGDCNFFEGLTTSKVVSDKLPLAKIGIGFGALILVMALIYGFFGFQSFVLKDQMKYLTDLKNSEALQRVYAANIALSGTVGDVEKDVEFMNRLIQGAHYSNTANIYLLRLIDECIGEDAKLRDLTVDQNSIVLSVEKEGSGSVEDVQAVTAIEHRFRESGHFSNVLIQNIDYRAVEAVETSEAPQTSHDAENPGESEPTEESEKPKESEEAEESEGVLSFSITLMLGGGAIYEESKGN